MNISIMTEAYAIIQNASIAQQNRNDMTVKDIKDYLKGFEDDIEISIISQYKDFIGNLVEKKTAITSIFKCCNCNGTVNGIEIRAMEL